MNGDRTRYWGLKKQWYLQPEFLDFKPKYNN